MNHLQYPQNLLHPWRINTVLQPNVGLICWQWLAMMFAQDPDPPLELPPDPEPEPPIVPAGQFLGPDVAPFFGATEISLPFM